MWLQLKNSNHLFKMQTYSTILLPHKVQLGVSQLCIPNSLTIPWVSGGLCWHILVTSLDVILCLFPSILLGSRVCPSIVLPSVLNDCFPHKMSSFLGHWGSIGHWGYSIVYRKGFQSYSHYSSSSILPKNTICHENVHFLLS